jgi:hypothetical protein
MHRCNASGADLLLDTWGWRCVSLPEAVAIHRTLAGYRGVHWPNWDATLRRLHAAAPFAVQDWCARLPQRQRTWEQEKPPPRQHVLFPLRPCRSG